MKFSALAAGFLIIVSSLAGDSKPSGTVLVTQNATTTLNNGSVVPNPSAFAATISVDVQRKFSFIPPNTLKKLISPEYWDLFVGPVKYASTTTTVSATPIPSSELVPPPPLYYSSFSTGHQLPLEGKNESWKFPKGFWWGVASAAYQIEGAVADEGRGPSNWDVYTHRSTEITVSNETGDIGDNQYYLYKQGKSCFSSMTRGKTNTKKSDIARIAALGVPYYSFSISWSRIFPFGKGQVNELGLAHYDDVINTCIKYNVKPMVTLYHWDIPLYLQNSYGGWLSERIVDDFTAYAKVVFERYGNRVSHWFTVNEPIVFCQGYPVCLSIPSYLHSLSQ